MEQKNSENLKLSANALEKSASSAKSRDDVRRTTRIIQIDEMLRGGTFVDIQDLIFKFGVNRRTIERDFEHLRNDMNAPLEYDRARKMYHYTDPTFSIPNVVLTEGELFTVATVMPLMEQYKNTPLENSFRSIMGKISGLLPDSISVDSCFLNRYISFISDPLPRIETEVFNSIFKAVRNRCVVEFDYKSLSSTVYKKRTLDAYRVICKSGNWYVFGFEHDVKDFRIFALGRIKNIVVKSEFFTIQKDFDLKKHIDLDFGIWNNTQPPEEYEIKFAKERSNYILERQWHKNQTVEILEDGSVLLKIISNQKEMIFNWVMSFGNAATVLKPERLRAEIKQEVLRVADKY